MNTISAKDNSFAIVAIRCNDENSVGKRKMTANVIYNFLTGYCVKEGSIYIDDSQHKLNSLYDDFFYKNTRGIPHVQISAIVGQNGSGKSSIVEFMMRLINNFAASSIGEMPNNGVAAERLHFIDGINGDLWYILEGNAYRLHVKNCHVQLLYFKSKRQKDDGIEYYEECAIFDNMQKDDAKEMLRVCSGVGDNELKQLYNRFFYTLISNQSIYAYNTLDFAKECNTDKKECDAIGYVDGQTFDTEDKCWLHGLFHKNDAYRTPLVITPYRREGNIDINNEHDLAIERLVKLYALNPEMRVINDHLKVEELKYAYDPRNTYKINKIKNRLKYTNLTQNGYIKLRNKILELWNEKLGGLLSQCDKRPYYNEAVDYLVYKTLKVSYQYKEHRSFYDASCTMTDAFNEDTLSELIDELVSDSSHITRKIYQTLAYLVFDIFNLPAIANANGEYKEAEEIFSFDELSKTWKERTKLNRSEDINEFLLNIRQQAIIPPPFLKMNLYLSEIDESAKDIDFESLSSGEKQQIYAISSLLYHLDNIESAHKDDSSEHRVKFRNVCILLEEIELYYHPQLQQQFILYFLRNLNHINLEHIAGIHLIIVTHSPYVLSDVPSCNVLALKKDDAEPIDELKTFGANIHDMLRDSFFLEGAAMGCFAQWEVSHLIACMKIHQWAKRTSNILDCPYIGQGSAYDFLLRYCYPNEDNPTSKKLFDYKTFCEDFSSDQVMRRILIIDEPVAFHILMDEFYRTFPEDENNQKELKRADLKRQLKELED